MSKIIETITIDGGKCTAVINVEVDGRSFKLAQKTTYDRFKTIEVEIFSDLLDYCTEEMIDGYTAYNIVHTSAEAIKSGDFRKMPEIVEKLDDIEKDLEKKKEEFKKFIERNKKNN